MLTKLVREDGGIKPVEAGVAPIDQFHQRIEHLCLTPDLVSKAEVLVAFDEAECLGALCLRALHEKLLEARSQEPGARRRPEPTGSWLLARCSSHLFPERYSRSLISALYANPQYRSMLTRYSL